MQASLYILVAVRVEQVLSEYCCEITENREREGGTVAIQHIGTKESIVREPSER